MDILARVVIEKSKGIDCDTDPTDREAFTAILSRDWDGKLLIIENYGSEDQRVTTISIDEILEFLVVDGYDSEFLIKPSQSNQEPDQGS